MRVAIAGARGFLGSHLAARLVADGHETVGIERDAYPRTIASWCPDALVYAGGPSHNVERLTATEAGACLGEWTAILDAAVVAGARHVILLSSHAVYGPSDRNHEEDEAPAPRTLYGALQASREHIGMAFHHSKGLPFTSLRLATVYGPGMRPDALVRVFLDAALSGGEIRLEGGGAQIRPFVHIDDAVARIASALYRHAFLEPFPDDSAGRTFNVVTDHDTIASLASLTMAAAVNLGRPGCRLITTEPRTAEVGHVRMSPTGGTIGDRLHPAIELKDGIPATARAMLEGR